MKKLIGADWFRCEKCYLRHKEMEEKSAEVVVRKQEADNKKIKKIDKGLLCCECDKPFEEGEQKYRIREGRVWIIIAPNKK